MSPFLLGTVASSGGLTSSVELIATVTGNSGSNTLTISGIPQTYKHLELRATVSTGVTTGGSTLYTRLNGSTSSYYSFWSSFGGNSSTITNASALSDTGNFRTAGNISANTYQNGQYLLLLPDYTSSVKKKTILWQAGGTNEIGHEIGTGIFTGTAAVTSISIIGGGVFTSNTVLSLYGIKG